VCHPTIGMDSNSHQIPNPAQTTRPPGNSLILTRRAPNCSLIGLPGNSNVEARCRSRRTILLDGVRRRMESEGG
jgi:hypothetical protein